MLAEDGSIIWLDYLPAFQHTTFVKPFFRFSFHTDVRETFNSPIPTYNQIHTDMLRAGLQGISQRVSKEQYDSLLELAELYDDTEKRYRADTTGDARDLFIEDAQNRGIISQEQADRFRASRGEYDRYRARELTKLGVAAFLDACGGSKLKLLWDKKFHRDVARFTTDPAHLQETILNNSVLLGMKKARDHGIVSDEEFENALENVSKKDLVTYVGMSAWYFLVARATDAVTVPMGVMAAKSDQPAQNLAFVAAFNTFAPGILRAVSTLMVNHMTTTELQKAASLSLIPMFGTYGAIPLQMKAVYGEKAANAVHYTLRALIATLSKLVAGGWGSDAEEKIWKLTHRRKT